MTNWMPSIVPPWSPSDMEWIAWVQSHQNAQDGFFAFPSKPGSNKPRRGIALWNAVRALNMLGGQITGFPPRAEKVVDAMLDLQGTDGFWHGRPAYSTMDAIYLLSRLPKAIRWREADADAALHRVVDALVPYYEAYAERDRLNTHPFAAVVQTFALLFEALPERFTMAQPWRFGWGNRAFWRCRVIEEALAIEG